MELYMGASSDLIGYDNLSVTIFSALATNALDTISSSAGQMLDVACLFFDKDVSKAMVDFQKLYLEHSKLDTIKSAINDEVDDIFEHAHDPDYLEAHQFDDNLAGHEIDELANIQKDLEAMIQQDDHIKQRMVPVMQCMQYEDIIINRIQRLIQCWEHMVVLLNSSEEVNISEELKIFDSYLSTEDEHEKFYSLVIETDYEVYLNTKDHDISQLEHNIDCTNTLMERFFKYSQESLNECIRQTQHAFDELINLLNLVTGESEKVGYLFSEKNESFDDIKNILSQHKTGVDAKAKMLIHDIAETRVKHSQEAESLIQSFMMALQSQDRIRQNIENMGGFHHHWSTFREKVKSSELFSSTLRQEFANEAMKQMSTESEREAIHNLMPGITLPDNSDAEEDDIFF